MTPEPVHSVMSEVVTIMRTGAGLRPSKNVSTEGAVPEGMIPPMA